MSSLSCLVACQYAHIFFLLHLREHGNSSTTRHRVAQGTRRRGRDSTTQWCTKEEVARESSASTTRRGHRASE